MLSPTSLHSFIDEHCAADAKLVLAYSGGVDSQVLLELLAGLANQDESCQVRAIHINHGLHVDAQRWQQHCVSQCEAHKIPLSVFKVTVAKGAGIEAEARKVRYEALFNALDADETLMLGHHLTDQIETVLLQLKRGAGPKGLSAMAASQLGASGHRLLRPLLSVSRQQIEQFARQHSLTWVEDPSNAEQHFERNFLRHDIVPRLTERWPSFGHSVQRSAELCAEQQGLLDEVSNEKLTHLSPDNDTLDCVGLQRESSAWQAQLVRSWLARNGIPMPSQAHLRALLQMVEAAHDKQPQWQIAGFTVQRFDGRLWLVRDAEAPPDEQILSAENSVMLTGHRGELVVSDTPDEGSILVSENMPSPEALRITYGDYARRFRPFPDAHSKPLKQWFKEWNIPPWERTQVPIITHENDVVAVILTDKGLVGGLNWSAKRLPKNGCFIRLVRR